ncbi:hypothetical protein BGZ61DRAFT_454958 [Ilyonectria robusta]|uniref:uncharacterized protein n=1 Tax=Ilyonectria robusta TaxID=1079257 RepID=UPI001E8DE21E|nr:uncharacterized protein BGZ61DRAFT_454958 [Ilyonectria robusta]KAH8685115.1 hypothetical protein BGZ61DRAFT_454958 [Ilyonectria robusta]
MDAKKAKKRAFRACLPCRARKVRCIVTGACQPCMNCKLDEKDCNFAKAAGTHPGFPRNRRGSETPDSHSSTDCYRSTQSPRGSDASGIDCTEQRASSNQINKPPGKPLSPTSNPNHPETLGLLYDPTDPSYSFLQAPKTQTILPQDLEFLNNQGCFIVPQRSVLDEFIHHYFSFIHPILPILNEADFWALYDSGLDGRSQDRISIIVLQGMLFTSCTFVSQETIKALGFRTTQDAKYSFYRRAKLLYDFGYERSSIAIAQAAVLLSHSHLIPLPYGGYKQLGSLWLGIAIHHARDARAHQYCSATPNNPMSPEEAKRHNVLKRLWMCCIICDRVIPLTSRQSIKITKSNFDFEGSPILNCDDLSDEFYHSNIYDSTTKIHLAQVNVKLVELCVILTDVLALSSSIRDNPAWGLSQRMAETNQASLCRIQLQRWYNTFLEMKSAMNGKLIQDSGSEGRGSSVVLFTNLAEMYYHSARLALCHYEMLYLGLAMSSSNPNLKITDMFEKSYELQNATSQITECLAELTRLRLIRWLPMSAVGCTAFPLALQILDVELFQPKHHNVSVATRTPFFADHQQQRLNMLIDAMKTYRPRYYIVDWVARTIRHIVSVAQQWLPSTRVRSGNGMSVASWIEILQLQPSCYLRLAMTMDLSISHGKLPEESDFPPGLRDVVRSSVTATLSPTIIPMGITHFRHLQSARETSKDTTVSKDLEAKSTPEFPSEDVLFDEGPTSLVDSIPEFDSSVGGISSGANVISSMSSNGVESTAFDNLGAWPDAFFPFNSSNQLPFLQPGPMDFQLGSNLDPCSLFDPSQWTDGQSNNEADVQQFQLDESLLEALRETASTSCRNSDERLLEQLGEAINMS